MGTLKISRVMLAWVGRLVNLPGTVDDIKAWRRILAPLATPLLLLWKSAREWIVNKADFLIALDRALLTIGWLSAALTVLVILAVIWNTYQARTRVATTSGSTAIPKAIPEQRKDSEDDRFPSTARIEEWLSFIRVYELKWISTGQNLAVRSYKRNLFYESMWVEMRPFLSSDVVKRVEITDPVVVMFGDQKARSNDLRRLIRRDLGVLLRKVG